MAPRTMFAYSVAPGRGGMGHHARHLLDSLAPLAPSMELFGPAIPPHCLVGHPGLRAHESPTLVANWRRRYTTLRYDTGRYQLAVDRGFGRWLAAELEHRPFERAYFMTQIAQEGLPVARALGARTILDNPNGHIRDFREALCRESADWTNWPYFGHPSLAMVERGEREYVLADRIRVSSEWSKRSLVKRGVDASKIFVAAQVIDVERFVPPPSRPDRTGPLRIVFVGSFSLGKGFQYLLEAVARLGPSRFQVAMVGATGDPWSRRLFQRLSNGLTLSHAPGDPLAALQQGELFVFPTVHDGFGLVVAEAMACGLPVITTDHCGAAEWIEHGDSGWVLPAGNLESLQAALEHALTHRDRLHEQGRSARRAVERHCSPERARLLGRLIEAQWTGSPVYA
jgi:glycosyltransferase involved in cell wall biosynthesis